MFSFHMKLTILTPVESLSRREEKMQVPDQHFVNGHPVQQPFSENLSTAIFELGCF